MKPDSPARRMTYADYLAMPEDGRRYEILDGELVEMSSPTTRHQRVLWNLIIAIDRVVRGQGHGLALAAPCDVVLAQHQVVQPDILYVSEERRAIVELAGVMGAPDLVIEVLSPSNRAWDRVRKRRVYGKAGVREYWIVDPEERRIEVYALAGEELVPAQEADGGELESVLALPGFRVNLAELFAQAK
jgi:Uma2 family endonuclease